MQYNFNLVRNFMWPNISNFRDFVEEAQLAKVFGKLTKMFYSRITIRMDRRTTFIKIIIQMFEGTRHYTLCFLKEISYLKNTSKIPSDLSNYLTHFPLKENNTNNSGLANVDELMAELLLPSSNTYNNLKSSVTAPSTTLSNSIASSPQTPYGPSCL